MKKETLLTTLEGMNKDELVYVGCKDGSNWIIIDTVENVINGMKKIDSHLHDDVQKSYRKAMNNLNSLPFKIVGSLEDINSGRLNEKELKRTKKLLAKYENNYFSAHQSRVKCEQLLNYWTPFGDRKVIDTYPHTVDDPGISILVDGSFPGNLWWKGEHKSLLE